MTKAPAPPISDLRVKELDNPVRGHIVELDSLRGVASVFVLLDHFRRLWLEASPPGISVYLRNVPFVANGRSAVMMFFALSGFVLTLPFLKGKRQAYLIYALRRICRIYIPYVIALGFAVLACWKFHGLEMYGREFHVTWRSEPTLFTVGKHLLFLGKFDAYAYDPPIWSLVHEMRISLIFPLLCLLCLRRNGRTACFVAFLFPVSATILERFLGVHGGGDLSGAGSIGWLRTLGYCGTFLVGSVLARHHEAIQSFLKEKPRPVRWLLLAIAIVLYQPPIRLHTLSQLENFATGIGSCYFILLALERRSLVSSFLLVKPFVFLGRISYSLYLVHLPILIMLAIAIYGKISFGYLLLPFFTLTLIVATFFNRLVEVPSIRLGRLIGAHRSPRHSIQGAAGQSSLSTHPSRSLTAPASE